MFLKKIIIIIFFFVLVYGLGNFSFCIVINCCTLLYGGIRSEESVWPKADWRAASLAEGRLARGLVDSRLMDFEFRDIQKPTDKVSFDIARLRVYRKSEVIVS